MLYLVLVYHTLYRLLSEGRRTQGGGGGERLRREREGGIGRGQHVRGLPIVCRGGGAGIAGVAWVSLLSALPRNALSRPFMVVYFLDLYVLETRLSTFTKAFKIGFQE